MPYTPKLIPGYRDGTFSSPVETTHVVPLVARPFKDYLPADLLARVIKRHYLVDPVFHVPRNAARSSFTNLRTYSEDFLNVAWSLTNLTLTASNRANPWDGQLTYSKLLETTANAEHRLSSAYTFTAVPHTISVLVAPGLNRTHLRLRANDGTTNFDAVFNVDESKVLSTSGATARVKRYDDGSSKISITFTPAAASGNIYLNTSTDGTTVIYVGDAAKGFYCGGVQVERASSPGPYIVTTSAAREVSVPDCDGLDRPGDGDDFAFLGVESDIEENTAAPAPIFRLFFRVPKPQTSYTGSRYFALPAIEHNFGESTSLPVWVIEPVLRLQGTALYNTIAGAIYTESDNGLYGPTKICGTKVVGNATAGTFTLSYLGDTTSALAWDADGATIAAALNGLASVSGAGLVAEVTNLLDAGTGGDLIIIWVSGGTITPVTMNPGGLTVTTSQHAVTMVSSLSQQDIFLPDHVTVPAHAMNPAGALAVLRVSEEVFILNSGSWGSVDANTIWTTPFGDANPAVEVAGFKRSYIPGRNYLLATRMVERFYLPGFSPGISTPGDIQSNPGLQNDADFVYALVNLNGWQVYDSVGATPWMNSPIHRTVETEINLG